MSTRALRKLQREQEIEKQVAAAKAAYEAQTEESSDEEVSSVAQPRNAFDMLNEENEDDDSEPGDVEDHKTPEAKSISQPHSTSKPKKKKKKPKKKAKEKANTEPQGNESGDEIDRALKEIAAKTGQNAQPEENPAVPWEAEATKLLGVEQKNLNPTNEMRSLFGNIALENNDSSSSSARTQRRRDMNLQGGLDLGTALTGRYSLASRGKGLGSLATRRNCFIQGKSEWPLVGSGGLSMENMQSQGFEKQYRMLHSQHYQEVQVAFQAAVNSMQADQMIRLLVANPYHVATLVQVSEIAKHQDDHSISGDLLERALFTIGRSVHSSFPAALREGNSRMDFNNANNREVYLAIWRYIRNLEMRGTWRTAFEWAKVLLQLNTMSDPYGVTLMIDQLALRGRQHVQLLELASDDAYGGAWKHLPNIQISLTLAYLRSQNPKEARRQLAISMHQYPYILSALASALEISPVPKSLWGKLPSTDAQKLYTELYVTRATDLWNTPEITALIVEVAETLDHYKAVTSSLSPAPNLEISLEEARHIMLLEIPQLIALLPRSFTRMPTSTSDPLPPPTSTSDFAVRAPTDATAPGPNALQAIFSAAGNAAGAPIQGANGLLQRVLNLFHTPVDTAGSGDINSPGPEAVAAIRAMREIMQAEDPDREITDELVEQIMRMQATENDEDVTFADLGMVGGWDYYAGESSDDAGDDTTTPPDLPGLEEMTRSRQLQTSTNPHAATVEEGDSDDGEPSQRGLQPNRGILRHVDSDEEEETTTTRPHPSQPDHTIYTSVQPQASNTTPSIEPTSSDPDPDNAILNSNDSQRIQRYLLTTGLTSLQAKPDLLSHYVRRLKLLRKQQQDWIVNILTQRGANGKEIADKIKRAL